MSAKVIFHSTMFPKPGLEHPFPIGNWEGYELEVVPDTKSPVSKVRQSTIFTLKHLFLRQTKGRGFLRAPDEGKLDTEALAKWLRSKQEEITIHFHPWLRGQLKYRPHVFRITSVLNVGIGILEMHIGIAEKTIEESQPGIWKIFEENFSS